ncbi:MAG: ATP-dependent zinc metalloprotease FtsH [Clostridia bacterium]|nr:ATP-dependent zinc metalloprotease FtsH [Clostridia bacterium]
MKKHGRGLAYLLVGLVVLGLIALFFFSDTAKNLSTDEFFQKAGIVIIDDNKADNLTGDTYDVGGQPIKILYNGKDDNFIIIDNRDKDFSKIVVSTYNLVAYNEKGIATYKASYPRDSYYSKMLLALQSVGVGVNYTDPNAGSLFSSLIVPILTIGVGILILVIFMRQAQGSNKSAMDFGKTKARVNQNVPVRFSDVAGAEEEKQELQEVVEFLKNPKKFSSLGARIPKGVLLVGPPGTGKTLFAKAVAGEANVPFFSISGSDFVEMFVGVGASRVRDLFAMAKKSMPCIVFIDEIDAVGRQRGAGLGGGNDEREQTLNQLLVQMDGFDSNEGIIIMAATNRADILDPALMRPGRFDRQVYINLPDVRGREAILKVHSRNKPLAADVSFKILARMTAGFSGADLANLLNEAAILAARANRKAITNEDLYEAIEKVEMGPKKGSRLVTESDKRITAYHEAGHAITAKLLPHCDEVHEVTIIPRGNAAGYTLTRPDSDDQHMSKNQLLDRMVMTLGGRAAEQIIIQDVTTGASQDIKQVSKIARAMVTSFGMSDKIGPVDYGSDDQIFVGRDYQTRTVYSESLATLIDEEVEMLVKNAMQKSVELLQANKDKLDLMARLLIEKETIYSEEVAMIMEGKDFESIVDFMEKNAERIKNDPFRTNAKKDSQIDITEALNNLDKDEKN